MKIKFFRDHGSYKLGQTYEIPETKAMELLETAPCYCAEKFDITNPETFKALMENL